MRTVADNSCAAIHVEGARVHNLQNITIDIPRDKIVVITGVSGSGKSSLARDTLFAEGQRQYIESLSPYARQFLTQLPRPDVDDIRGLPPTIAIDQRSGVANPRSTVATITEIYDFLRVLYARTGVPHCPECGSVIRQQSPEQILDDICTIPDGTRLMILAPLVRGKRGEHNDTFRKVFKSGYVRARVDGVLVDVEEFQPNADGEPPKRSLDPNREHNIEAVIDRVVLKETPEMRSRLSESLKLALTLGEGAAIAVYEKDRTTNADGTTQSHWRDVLYSTLYACGKCKTSFHELEPRSFSFNSPYGACPVCHGFGHTLALDPDAIIPDPIFSISKGAIVAWKLLPQTVAQEFRGDVEVFLNSCVGAGTLTVPKSLKSVLDIPLCQLDESLMQRLLWGENNVANVDDSAAFVGVIGQLEKFHKAATSRKEQSILAPFMSDSVCRSCRGSRLRRESRSVTLSKKRIYEVTAMTVAESLDFFQTLELSEEHRVIAKPLVEQIVLRLDFMRRIGLDYLTLDRGADTLSGGELQRVRLATGLGNGLVGVCYILDEPSVGLHPRDNRRLIEAMREMQQRGNTVVVVEHDEAMMRAADWLIDIGPGAGVLGGCVMAAGTPDEVSATDGSLTGRYLRRADAIVVPAKRRRIAKSRAVTLEGVTTNNLKNVDVTFPLGALVCVTGVSGSGKSSLIGETLVPAIQRRLAPSDNSARPGPYVSLRGAAKIDKLILVDQNPIGRTYRSNPATYTGLFDEIRHVFAQTRDAKRFGYKASRFSFNVAGGRCESCQGQGVQKIEMHFLPEMYAECPVCHGARFSDQTLRIRFKGHSIADVLTLSVVQALEVFANIPTIVRILQSLRKVGLGYLTLGQSATTLSGGEAQRIKLATELARVETGNTLYVLDEPTSGLHTHDVGKLLEVLAELVDLGNTVIVVEHNLDVIKTADWVIDLGPEGGQSGGRVIATGTPEEIVQTEESFTGRFLREVL
ncbi:MAG: excinuclease ABC subunit UvrA [Thermoguttaceae bacterium]